MSTRTLTQCLYLQSPEPSPPSPEIMHSPLPWRKARKGAARNGKKSQQTLSPSPLPYRTTPPPISPSPHPQITSESKTANNLSSGGEEVLLDVGGQDSTEAFEDVGHSDEAREILDGLLVGTVKRVVRTESPSTAGLLFNKNQHIYPRSLYPRQHAM